ncbi:hypothetical protein [Streptomyces flavidovirens]|nr:hypothetical protein [Streptomyces flavidovirens]
MATGIWELTDAVWQETELLLWKPSAAWFSINARKWLRSASCRWSF